MSRRYCLGISSLWHGTAWLPCLSGGKRYTGTIDHYCRDNIVPNMRRYPTLLPQYTTPHSHSMVRIGPNELICHCKENSSALKTSVARTVRCAWLLNSKRNLIAPEILCFQPLSISIGPLFPIPLAPPHRRTADIAENYRQQREGLTAMSLGAIAARLRTGLRQASPATCRTSVARSGQPREKRSVRGEPAGYELSEEPHALRLACLPLCEKPERSVHVQVGARHPHQ